MPKYAERAAGIYRCTFQGTDEREFTDKDTGEPVPRWVWKFQEVADSTTFGFIDQITGTSLKSANSNAYKLAAGVLGHKLQPGDDTDTAIGAIVDVVYGPNQAGNLAVTSVVRVGAQNAPQAATAAPAAPVVLTGPRAVPTSPNGTEGIPDDLPF